MFRMAILRHEKIRAVPQKTQVLGDPLPLATPKQRERWGEIYMSSDREGK